MRDIQDKVLDELEYIIQYYGFEALKQGNWANTGHLSIQRERAFGEIARVNYYFQSDRMTLSLSVNGVSVLSQPPRQGYYDFYMSHSDTAMYSRFITALKEGLQTLKNG